MVEDQIGFPALVAFFVWMLFLLPNLAQLLVEVNAVEKSSNEKEHPLLLFGSQRSIPPNVEVKDVYQDGISMVLSVRKVIGNTKIKYTILPY